MKLLLTLVALLGFSRTASAAEYRKILLTDGRTLQARVDGADDTGLTMGVPQGQIRVPFEQVLSLEPIDEAAYNAQPSWVVYVLPFTGDVPKGEAQRATDSVRYVLGRLPSVKTLGQAELAGLLGPARAGALTSCKSDPSCVAPLAAQVGVTALVSGQVAPEDGANTALRLDLRGVFTATTAATGVGEAHYQGSAPSNGRALLQAAALSLLVQPTEAVLGALPAQLPVASSEPAVAQKPAESPAENPTGGTGDPWGTGSESATPPTATPTGPGPTAGTPASLTSERLHALAFVPLPGAPSLVRKDWAGFASSWAVAVPCTAALVATSGGAAFTKTQLVALGAGSYYASAVLSNLIFGSRSGGAGAPTAAVGLAPASAAGPATVAVSVGIGAR